MFTFMFTFICHVINARRVSCQLSDQVVVKTALVDSCQTYQDRISLNVGQTVLWYLYCIGYLPLHPRRFFYLASGRTGRELHDNRDRIPSRPSTCPREPENHLHLRVYQAEERREHVYLALKQ